MDADDTRANPVADAAEAVTDAVGDAVRTATDAVADAARAAAEHADALVDAVTGAAVHGRVSRFTHAGATLVLEEHGEGEPLFLLIHGIGMGRMVFADLVTHLEGRGRIWTVDQPGYGEAPEPERTLTMERTADLVAALLRARGESAAVVVGHSMGSQVAAELAARHPDLVGALVLAAPTVDSGARRALRQVARLARDLPRENLRELLLGGREYLRAGPNLRRKMRAMLVHRPEDAYPRITAPALVVRGALDGVSPHAWCAEVAQRLSGAPLVELDGHGHETLIRDAGPAAAAILRFLAEHRPHA
ncbi:alpha/beta fold hydrolase [Microbacterium sp.]|uniref:alpha/beta fold hydrolase n=1 Tax=Microbacterium sp. TaxID=51671 RepID=UPI0039E6AD72